MFVILARGADERAQTYDHQQGVTPPLQLCLRPERWLKVSRDQVTIIPIDWRILHTRDLGNQSKTSADASEITVTNCTKVSRPHSQPAVADREAPIPDRKPAVPHGEPTVANSVEPIITHGKSSVANSEPASAYSQSTIANG
jgi:hypothetical protein